jgi:hypothetical protein
VWRERNKKWRSDDERVRHIKGQHGGQKRF